MGQAQSLIASVSPSALVLRRPGKIRTIGQFGSLPSPPERSRGNGATPHQHGQAVQVH